MIEFPTLVFKDKGPHHRPGGMFSYKPARHQAEYDAAIADGWAASLESIINPAPAKLAPSNPIPEDDAPVTRVELEAKAQELGLKFDGRTTDKALASKIEAALSGD